MCGCVAERERVVDVKRDESVCVTPERVVGVGGVFFELKRESVWWVREPQCNWGVFSRTQG
jgi:hypothetical protein